MVDSCNNGDKTGPQRTHRHVATRPFPCWNQSAWHSGRRVRARSPAGLQPRQRPARRPRRPAPRCCSARILRPRATSTASRTPRSTAPRSRSTRRASPASTRSRLRRARGAKRQLEDIGGRVRLGELAALVPATANASHGTRASSTRRATLRCSIRAGGENTGVSAGGPARPEDLVDQAEQILYDLSRINASPASSEIEELLKESLQAHHPASTSPASTYLDAIRGTRDLDKPHVRVPAGQPHHHRRPSLDG